MKKLATLTLLALVLAACGSSKPGSPVPTVLGTQAPGQATSAPIIPHY